MQLINHLKWRYATKKFDPSKDVSELDIEKLKKAIQLSPSSYGLQLYKVLVIKNKALKEELLSASWNQNQVVDASHLFVFCQYSSVTSKDIDNIINLTAITQNTNFKKLEPYGDFIKSKINEKTDIEKNSWLKAQTYIALTNLLGACAELKIDSCPLEGFDTESYNKILNLSNKGLKATVIAAVGYRHNHDHTIERKKVRKPIDVLFETI